MPLPESDSPPPAPKPSWAGANGQLHQLVAAAADLCRRPLRHGVLLVSGDDGEECQLRLEARGLDGERQPQEDLELDLFASGNGTQRSLHLTLAWREDPERPLLWHGQHPVWMDPQGNRCPRPEGGASLEALARRLRALLGEAG